MPRPLLVASEVVRRHGERTVLDRVSLTLDDETRLAMLGPNGSGKSTLLRVLAEEEPADGGTVRRIGRGVRVGYLPQEPDPDAASVRECCSARLGVVGAAAGWTRSARGSRTAIWRPSSRTPRRSSSGWRSAARTRTSGRGGGARARARPGDARARRHDFVGRAARAGRARGDRRARLDVHCSTSRPTTSTPTGSSGSARCSTASTARSCSCRTTASCSRARARRCSSSTATPGPPRSTTAATRPSSASASSPAAGDRRARGRDAERERLRSSRRPCVAGRARAPSERARSARSATTPTSHCATSSRRARRTARRTECGRKQVQRVEVPDKPWEAAVPKLPLHAAAKAATP